jgi:hypothetical protein
MFDLATIDAPIRTGPLPDSWTAERYLEILHPRNGRGVVSGLTIQGDQVRSHTWPRDLVGAAAATMTEQESYVAINRTSDPGAGAGVLRL